MGTSLEELQLLLEQVRDGRRSLVQCVLAHQDCTAADVSAVRQAANALSVHLQRAHTVLMAGHDPSSDYRRFITGDDDSELVLNLHDELYGLRKDTAFVEMLLDETKTQEYLKHYTAMLCSVLPVDYGYDVQSEVDTVLSMLQSMATSPCVITDWDGTVKTYSSQYVTCVQPAADALVMCLFAKQCTHLAAVLTAGPLRQPGILDLTCVPEQGWWLFGGSWGREWCLQQGRVHDQSNMTDSSRNALGEFADLMHHLLTDQSGDKNKNSTSTNGNSNSPNGLSQFHQFSMVGSGFQRKVDRLSLGVQSVCGKVSDERRAAYTQAVRQLVTRVDPHQQYLTIHEDERDLEVCVRQSGGDTQVWTKGTGIKYLETRVLEGAVDLSARPLLICGDTVSDISMVEYALSRNTAQTYAIFVNASPVLKQRLKTLLQPDRLCFVSSPSVLLAAMAQQVLVSKGVK